MDDQEYKERVQNNLKNERKDMFSKLFVYLTAFAVVMDIFFVLRVCEVEWTMNRSMTEATIYFIIATTYLICFIFRRKLGKLVSSIRAKITKKK